MVETPSMLKAKLLLSGVKETSKVGAPIPLLSIHVAKEREPITRRASAECSSDSEINKNMRSSEDNDEDMGLSVVRLGRERRIVLWMLRGRNRGDDQGRGILRRRQHNSQICRE